jgi:predicted lipoprotein with Yx(FWY)xxD motif
MTRHLRHPRRTVPIAVAGLVAVGVLAAGCGSSGYSSGSTGQTSTSQPSAAATATVATGTVAGLGTVLEDGSGRVVYIFTPDGTSRVTCTGGCASAWPPVTSASGTSPSAGGTAQVSLLGTMANPGGGTVVTYAGHPLYTYAGDSGPGVASGQGSGGKWYVITPTGTVKDAS